MVAVENTGDRHNMVVCTLCSTPHGKPIVLGRERQN